DLQRAGVKVAAVLEARTNPDSAWREAASAAGIEVRCGHVVTDVRGGSRVRAVRTAAVADNGCRFAGEGKTMKCDLVAVSGGFSPVVHLQSQSGARPRFDDNLACFVPGAPVQPQRSAGSAQGTWLLPDCLHDGFEAGAQAAADCGFVADA